MMLNNNDYRPDEAMRDVYMNTDILRRPISGIVSGYHDLPYILVAPSLEDGHRTSEVTGRISVSPKFILSASTLSETFGDVFEPDTFDSEIVGRVFSFTSPSGRNVKVESKNFTMRQHNEPPKDYAERVLDSLLSKEDTKTGLIFSPDLRYYPVSIDKFISEIIDREFRA
ncbi:MAG: hypothetical protein LBC70_10825 [Chitinispirillales bacterium]|jgi:hypothetical protein|nr:hypothetical protein [Chitinispirillales bacterium]